MSLTIKITSQGDLKGALEAVARAKMVDLHKELVDMSPVDEGTFKGAWTVDPATGEIANNEEYAEALANGWSPQAPKGWIEAAIDKHFR